MKMSEFAIEAINVSKRFGEQIVLSRTNLMIERGKIVGIVGRNGSGKTVLFKCIAGLTPVSSGTVRILGKPIYAGTILNSMVGLIIENPGFLPNYSGYQNLSMLYSISKKADKDTIKGIIRTVGLDPDDKKHVGKYSLGMRQRLGIAQAIMEDPAVLILDEPMNGLDNNGVKDMRKLFLSLKEQGKTILLACHNREDIDALCDEVYRMDKGILVKE
jgi:ABC-2 type transport system ATP-binding protein